MGLKKLEYDLIRLCDKHDKHGSFATRADRKRLLLQMARQLRAMGYRDLRAGKLGGRHVNRLARLWQEEGLSVGAMKNRMSGLRWWAARVGRVHVIARKNGHYGIPSRPLHKISRAVALCDDVLHAIDGPHRHRIGVSLRLQRYLGLRTEESLKIRPAQAIERDAQGIIVQVHLRGSWCKNGRPRSLLIRDERQREALEAALQIAGNASMIPIAMSYVQYLKTFQYRCGKVGLTHRHGLRHRYAQERYQELTGSLPPNCDGPINTWGVDDRARHLISEELGHGRKNVTSAYLGPVRPEAKSANPRSAERSA
jgi:Phage integrase, N-terminal/Integrase